MVSNSNFYKKTYYLVHYLLYMFAIYYKFPPIEITMEISQSDRTTWKPRPLPPNLTCTLTDLLFADF